MVEKQPKMDQRWKMLTAAQLGLPMVRIDTSCNKDRDGGGGRWNPAFGSPKISWRGEESPPGAATSPAAITAMAVFVGDFKMKIS